MLLVFGSLNADLLFQVEALPRPGETVLCPGYRLAAGGKGANQATAAAKAGGAVRMVGQVGGDSFGRFLREVRAGKALVNSSESSASTRIRILVMPAPVCCRPRYRDPRLHG